MKKLFILLIYCLILTACKDLFTPNERSNKIYEQALQAQQVYDWENATKLYKELINLYPKSELVNQAKENMTLCSNKQQEISTLVNEIYNFSTNGKKEEAFKKQKELLGMELSQSYREFYKKYLDNEKLELADQYYNKKGNKNKSKSFNLFKEVAENGNAYAQYSVGFMLQNGQGTKANLNEAEKWYKKSAEQGYETSIKELKKIEKLKALDNKTADRKLFKFYNFLGKDISDILRATGGNYDLYKDEQFNGINYICYYYTGFSAEQLYVCHNKGSNKVSGVGYRYPFNMMNISNLPKTEYTLPKSFSNLKYEHNFNYPNETRIYSIKNEEWKFYITRDVGGNSRIYGVSIFIL